ncbi:hypothetical protein [Bacillus sp. (in: firmicutes)]|uniref:hypothetical protein n=1 Tax=Bacillus sp. TaxID=1409 RepID=UPI0029012ACD|nr:hypothetical protein [Bacillus sp. (in: firmicutes)]MDU2391863.1 hypothetical protein [Bacillus sp. (in: firmicutes)]
MSHSELPKSIIEEQKESFIMFPKVLLHENEYEGRDLDILHLVIIKSLANNFTKAAITSVNDLMVVKGVNPKNKDASQATRESIVRLQAMNYITIYENRKKTKKVVNIKPAQTYFIEPTREDEDCFAKVFESDIEKIITMQSNYKAKLFIIYLAIVSYLFYYHDKFMEHKSVWTTIEKLADITQLDRKTVMKYIKQLHEKEVLFVITTKVEAKKNKNFYGRYKHKELITEEAITNTGVLQRETVKLVEGVVE